MREGGSTLAGELILIDIKHDGEVLWVGTAPVVESVEPTRKPLHWIRGQLILLSISA